MNSVSHLRQLGKTDIYVAPVAMGCWPIAGMTSINVNDDDSEATLLKAVESGVNFFDTAYGYGVSGESERLIGKAIGHRRNEIVIATKGGMHWNSVGQRQFNGRPERLRKECEESLARLGTDRVDLLYLHAPDPLVPVAESAGELRRLMDEGKTMSVGVSNFTVDQMDAFHSECEISAVQPHYNMLQREIEVDVLPWCIKNEASAITYWPLMKGLLAGKLPRDHVFQSGDGRAKYPMFQGEEWDKNQDFIDALRTIAIDANCTVAQLVVKWTIDQQGITTALCGAKRAYQIEETAAAMMLELSEDHRSQVSQAIEARGQPITQAAV